MVVVPCESLGMTPSGRALPRSPCHMGSVKETQESMGNGESPPIGSPLPQPTTESKKDAGYSRREEREWRDGEKERGGEGCLSISLAL